MYLQVVDWTFVSNDVCFFKVRIRCKLVNTAMNMNLNGSSGRTLGVRDLITSEGLVVRDFVPRFR